MLIQLNLALAVLILSNRQTYAELPTDNQKTMYLDVSSILGTQNGRTFSVLYVEKSNVRNIGYTVGDQHINCETRIEKMTHVKVYSFSDRSRFDGPVIPHPAFVHDGTRKQLIFDYVCRGKSESLDILPPLTQREVANRGRSLLGLPALRTSPAP